MNAAQKGREQMTEPLKAGDFGAINDAETGRGVVINMTQYGKGSVVLLVDPKTANGDIRSADHLKRFEPTHVEAARMLKAWLEVSEVITLALETKVAELNVAGAPDGGSATDRQSL